MKRLALAPHRLYFFLGTLAVALLFGWWWLNLHSAHSAQAVPLHALLMPLGIFPLFILGFTFTAGPRWLAVDASDRYFLLNGGTYFSGLLLVLLASGLGWFPLRTSGFALMLSAWLAVSLRWGALVRASKVPDKKHPLALLMAMGGGALALASALVWSAGVAAAWLPARQLAFFAFLLPVFLTVCHRMLPFFTANVLRPYASWRPYWLLGAWLAACLLLAAGGIAGWHALEAAVAGLLSASFAYTSWRWGLLRSLQNRLLAMLHLSFAWLCIVFALYAASAAGLLAGSAGMGSAAIHALGLGFMATMLVGFVSRVSYGHSGRPLQAGNLLWSLYLGLHLAAALRVLASLLNLSWLTSASASIWLILLLLWVALMAPVYLKARADGQAG